MTGRSFVVAIALLSVLAGCVSPLAPDGTATSQPTPTPSPTPQAAGGSAATPTATGGAGKADAGPWGSDPVVVAVENEGEPGRSFDHLVGAAAAYWEENASRYAGHPIQYEVRPDAASPDVVVKFVQSVPDCGNVSDAVGCAPRITDAAQIDRPETVWIQTGLSDASTLLVLKHELGHTLGLGHDDSPRDVMQAESVLYTEPKPNATERSFPWEDGTFTVSVDAQNASDPEGARRQVSHALDYYEDGAPGMPDNITFTHVASDDADIHIRIDDSSSCSDTQGSCINTYGTDPDGDDAIEEYTRARITLVGIDTKAVGWHVGYWLAYAFGAEDDADKPEPFRDADYRDRRSEWWRR